VVGNLPNVASKFSPLCLLQHPYRDTRHADTLLGSATEEHAMRQDDRHHAFVFEEVEALDQEGEVGGELGS